MAVRKKKFWGSIKPSVGYGVEWGDSITKGLVSYWLFNEGAGNKVYDIVNKANGTLTSMAFPPTATSGWVPTGKFGKAIAFDGTNDYVLVPDTPRLRITNTITINMWIKPTAVNAFYTAINKYSGAAGYYLYAPSDVGGMRFYTNGVFVASNASIITANVWQMVTVTYDLANVKFYVNAVGQGSAAKTDSMAADTTNLLIGTNDGTVQNFSGGLDNIRIYNRILSQAEILRLYSEPFAGVQTHKRRWLTSPGITFDAASNSGYQAAASTYNWSHTCTGSNLYLTVGISMLSLAQTVSGITYNSVAMTFLGAQNSVSGAARVELWGLVAPATGSNTIAVTLTGAIASAGNASSYAGVHQTSPTESFNSAQATNVGAADATVNVTTVANNDWCVDILATDDTAVTVGAGQTQTGNVTGAGGSGTMSYEGPQTPAGTVTMSWTNVAALATWSIGSIALRPVAAGGLSGLFRFFFMN